MYYLHSSVVNQFEFLEYLRYDLDLRSFFVHGSNKDGNNDTDIQESLINQYFGIKYFHAQIYYIFYVI